jgi:hypothetical protein
MVLSETRFFDEITQSDHSRELLQSYQRDSVRYLIA